MGQITSFEKIQIIPESSATRNLCRGGGRSRTRIIPFSSHETKNTTSFFSERDRSRNENLQSFRESKYEIPRAHLLENEGFMRMIKNYKQKKKKWVLVTSA